MRQRPFLHNRPQVLVPLGRRSAFSGFSSSSFPAPLSNPPPFFERRACWASPHSLPHHASERLLRERLFLHRRPHVLVRPGLLFLKRRRPSSIFPDLVLLHLHRGNCLTLWDWPMPTSMLAVGCRRRSVAEIPARDERLLLANERLLLAKQLHWLPLLDPGRLSLEHRWLVLTRVVHCCFEHLPEACKRVHSSANCPSSIGCHLDASRPETAAIYLLRHKLLLGQVTRLEIPTNVRTGFSVA